MNFRQSRIAMTVAVIAGLVIFGQQCSRTPLEPILNTAFSLSKNPFTLNAPSDYPVLRRYVILVDMSSSMVSGPCPQDVDAGMLFQTLPRIGVYDPNKGTGDRNDHRADGADCQVNPNLPIKRASIALTQPDFVNPPYRSYETTLGSDYEGDRFKIIRTWIDQIKNSSTPQTMANTQIMLWPFSGGKSQQKIIQRYPMLLKFYSVDDRKLNDALNYLEAEQWINLVLAQSPLPYRYQNKTMGTSAPGALIPSIHDALSSDMYTLNLGGLLPFAEYRFIHLSDGMWTPFVKKMPDGSTFNQLDFAMSIFPECSACQSGNPGSCTAACSQLVTSMKDTWGAPEDQDLATMNFNYGKIQSLPQYYGNGFLNVDFVELKPERHQSLFPGEPTYYEQLIPLFESKNRTAASWVAEDHKPPFDLALNDGSTINFKVTNVYLLNANARLDVNGNVAPDSDGDGLIDAEEMRLGFDPLKSRSDGVCLDSIAANPTFKARCEALSQSRLCDPTLDSDGDSLNECEEMILGTNPFGFDTDGDTIPDSLEWIYGYNPQMGDSNLDSNGDGIPNLINFANGLGPSLPYTAYAHEILPNYALNYLGRGTFSNPVFGQVSLEQYQLMLYHIPTVETRQVPESMQVPLYATRVSANPMAAAANRIPQAEQLIAYSSIEHTNQILVLARMIDITIPKRVYWRVYKHPVAVGAPIDQPIIDLSQFKQIRAIDLNAGTGM